MSQRNPGPSAEPGSAAESATDLAAARAAGLVASPPVLVIVDFDGTLAPIVAEPSAARIVPAARRALRRLATIATPAGAPVVVAVLSGRGAGDVARRVGVPGVLYLGQHGIERARLATARADPEIVGDPAIADHGPALDRLADRTVRALGGPAWLAVERKGTSIGLHYRRAEDPDRARQAIHEALDAAQRDLGVADVARLESRRVVELRPGSAHGKGEATRRLIREIGPGSVLVVGDDRTDARAFAVVRELRAAGTVRALVLGVSGAAETPDEVRDGVDIMIPSPGAAATILDALAMALDSRPSA